MADISGFDLFCRKRSRGNPVNPALPQPGGSAPPPPHQPSPGGSASATPPQRGSDLEACIRRSPRLEGESARLGRSPQSSRWGANTPPVSDYQRHGQRSLDRGSWCRVPAKQVHLSSCSFVPLRGSSSLTIRRFSSNDPPGRTEARINTDSGKHPPVLNIGGNPSEFAA